ncbi:MAG: ATP-dependent helicase [Kineosporiaceae bacterium]
MAEDPAADGAPSTPEADAAVLERFSPLTRAWFRGAFERPTPAQTGAWRAISEGRDALVVAPTGSGKTLAAFLWALDGLVREPDVEPAQACRVLYVSPLKALAVDVERNLRGPLAGIRQAAARAGARPPEIRVGVRSGDTTQAERRELARTPPDILITTPESLYLLMTSAARESLRGVRSVILDEVHALAGTKRGAHLALTLERLDARLERPAQRVGLSATVRPLDEVARWLSGSARSAVEIVAPASPKQFDLRVVVPVPDMTELDSPVESATEPGFAPGEDLSGLAAGAPRRPSIWPHVEERVVDLVAEHRSTLVFANSRRLAERLTARLNEIWTERHLPAEDDDGEDDDGIGAPAAATGLPDQGAVVPAEVMAASGASRGAPAVLARAHHGSVSKEQRALIEGELKAGRLPAVVATSSLELGIDMGAVDLVVQVESPPSVASGLQRVGRAGHQVGAVSRGVLFPKFRSDLVQTAVVVERMRQGRIEALKVPSVPLDVLAQQVVAMVAMDTWDVEELFETVRRAAPFHGLTRPLLEAVLDMLSGRYPSDEFASLRPRLVWDRHAATLTARPGSASLAVTSGGTIPDRGLFGVFLAGEQARGGRRVGELDEEMVYESRVGDVFTLGSSTWRIEEITHDRVLVTPAPGQPGRLPFWKGESQGRPAELGEAVGGFVRELVQLDRDAARARVRAAGLDEWAADNLLTYLEDQRAATGTVPDDRRLLVERFRDELGDWRVVVHSPYGAQVHAPWALALAARARERFGVEVQAVHHDDGIVLRLPDLATEDGSAPEVADLLVIPPEDVEDLVTANLGASALFAARFRECAGRALLLPRRRPGTRQPLWQQRQRAAQLLDVASRYPGFPIVLETVRECLQDVFDVPALVQLMRDVERRRITVSEVETATASPFARGLLFGYVAQFLYEGDSPLAERRAAALSLDPALLAELLGRSDGVSLSDLLDPDQLRRTEAGLQWLDPERHARDAEGVADMLRVLGPLGEAEVAARCTRPEEAAAWLADLRGARRVIEVRIAGTAQWAAIEDAGRLRDALGTPLPVGIPEAFTEPVTDPLADLLSRYARRRGPFSAARAAARFGIGPAVATATLRRLVQLGRLVEGDLRPSGVAPVDSADGPGDAGPQEDEGLAGSPHFCDAEVLRVLRRRSLAALRAEVEPVEPRDLARFLPRWHGVSAPGVRSVDPDALVRAVEQLAGLPLPASAWETLVLPTRVPGYSPALLDELTAAGELVWAGHGALPGDDGWVSLQPADLAHVTLPPADATFVPGPVHEAVLTLLAQGGGWFFRALVDGVGGSGTTDAQVADALWDLVWAGLVTNDTLAALRVRLSAGRTAHRPRAAAAPRSRPGRPGASGFGGLRQSLRTGRPAMPTRAGPPVVAGRWSLVPARDQDPTVRGHAAAELLLERYGVVTRGGVEAEGLPGGFGSVYRVLSAMEEAGRVRRGYFVEGLGASQFATVGAVDRLRAVGKESSGSALVLAATDPANPFGAALPWPERPGEDGASRGHRPGRKAGAVVVLDDGRLVLYVERGGRTFLSWSEDPELLRGAAAALAQAVRAGVIGRLSVERADGEGLLGSGHPLADALAAAGFHVTPRGLRLRA